ncbi:hypothetical protein HY091_03055 [Candidatus Kaiserbacteria bacterium]|nr:hypothetical protein [Candidatus Kaiserbacteria bacterium]
MIDTIILTLPRDKATMLDLTGRGVPRWDLQARTKTYEKYVKNASSKDEEGGLYFPRLTGFKRAMGKLAWQSSLKIEFSAPKLLYQNNLDELRDTDFERVLEALDDRLKQMGVAFPLDLLRNASVSSVHYSKNIELEDGYTSQYVISELGKINMNKRFDLTRARFMNDGQSLYLYTVAHSFVLYDKIADLAKGKKRAIDKDQTPYQTSLFQELKREKEILRLEVRLSQRRKMNALFKELGFGTDPTFRDVFSKAKSKKVLNHYWDTMVAGNSMQLFTHAYTPKDLLKRILVARKGAKGKTAVYLTGLLLLARDENGLRELRSILDKRNDDRTWYRLAADARDIADNLYKMRPREWYGQVKRALSSYQLVQVACKLK